MLGFEIKWISSWQAIGDFDKIINVVIEQHGRPLKTEYSFDEHKCAGSLIVMIDAKTFAKSIRLI